MQMTPATPDEMNTPDRQLESFVRTHREAFDDRTAPAGLWNRIDRDLRPVRTVHPIWKWTAVAASALLLVLSGYLFGLRTPKAPPVAGWSEYQEAEAYYTTAISEKMDQIRQVGADQEVLEDIRMLDDVYEQLRSELFDDPNADPQLILSTMIRHHQQKLDIMEKILERIDKYKKHEDAYPL